MMGLPAGVVGATLLASAAYAHDVWSNGDPIPPWVKANCCGQADAHHIPFEAVRIMADGYHVEGIDTVIPFGRALPSQDGSYWGFWNPNLAPDVTIYCFFSPAEGS